jgi:hypothetical protein
MSKLVTQCPACRERLVVTRLTCPTCALHLDGQFELPPLLGLDAKDLDFAVRFVRASGSLKAMAKLEGSSYPTIRARLDELIGRIGAAYGDGPVDLAENEILDAIANGTMTAAEGAAKLKELKR